MTNASATALLRTHGVQFVRLLQSALRLVELYSGRHGQTQSLLQQALVPLRAALRDVDSLAVGFRSDKLVLNEVFFADVSLGWLSRHFADRGIGTVAFERGINETSFAAALDALATQPEAITEQGGLASFAAAHPLESVRIEPADTAGTEGGTVSGSLLTLGIDIRSLPSPQQVLDIADCAAAHLTDAQKQVLSQLHELLVELSALAAPAPAGEGVAAGEGRKSPKPAEVSTERFIEAVKSGDLCLAERLLRGLAHLLHDPGKVLECVAECEDDAVMIAELHNYARWLSLPAQERLNEVNRAAVAAHSRWLLIEVECACAAGRSDYAAQLLLALYCAVGPESEADRVQIFSQANRWLGRLCSQMLPGNATLLVDALMARLLAEDSSPAASLLAETMIVLVQAAAEHHEIALASAGASVLAKAVAPGAPHAATITLLGSRLLKQETVSELIASWMAAGAEAADEKALVSLLRVAGGQAAPEILRLLENESVASRRMRLLQLMKRLGRRAIPVLCEKLGHQQWFVVRNAVLALGDSGDPELIEHIGPALRYNDDRVQKAALDAVMRTHHPNRGPALARALLHFKPTVIESALDDLFVLREANAVTFLEQLVRRRHAELRPSQVDKALMVLSSIETSDAVQSLHAMSDDSAIPLTFRKTALRMLARMDSIPAERALRHLARTSQDPTVAAEAQALLPIWDRGAM